METAPAGANAIYEPPASPTIDRKTEDSGRLKVICSYGGAFVPHASGDPSPIYTGGDSKLVYIDPSLSRVLLISALCSLFPGAGLDASGVALKCRLPGDSPDAVTDVPDDVVLRSVFAEFLRRAKNPLPLAKKSTPLRLFLCIVPPPDPASSSPVAAAEEDPPLIDLSTPTSTDKMTPEDDIPPELLSLMEEIKDDPTAGGAHTDDLIVSVQEDSPPPPPSRWIKPRRSSAEGNPTPPTSPGATVTRLLCDENGKVVGYCTLDPSFKSKDVLVVGPEVF